MIRLDACDGLCLAATNRPALRETGKEVGSPILLVHGFSNNRFVWDEIAEGLRPRHRTLAVDLRGHGDSDWSPDARYGVPDYASDLPAVLDAAGIERAVVVGHSLGGNAGTLFAASHPERVSALVLVDTGPSLSLGAMMYVARDVSGALRSYATEREYRELLETTYPVGDRGILARMAHTGLVRRIDGRYEPKLDPGILTGPSDPEHWVKLERQLWRALRGIHCPSLLVRGGLSAMLAEKVATEMTDSALPNASRATVPRAGHAVMVDDGPGLLREIVAFLGARRLAGV